MQHMRTYFSENKAEFVYRSCDKILMSAINMALPNYYVNVCSRHVVLFSFYVEVLKKLPYNNPQG